MKHLTYITKSNWRETAIIGCLATTPVQVMKGEDRSSFVRVNCIS